MPSVNWETVRRSLEHDIEVFYVKDTEINRQREADKVKTVNWIIERMQKGASPEGTRTIPPTYTLTFGNLWVPIRGAIKIAHPFCQRCGGQLTAEVHHIRPKSLDGSRYDPCNLVGLCEECHQEIHRQLDWGIKETIRKSLDGVRL